MIYAFDVMDDILKFRGFWKASFVEKLKWLFVLYPFMLFCLGVFIFGNILYAVVYILTRLLRRKQ